VFLAPKSQINTLPEAAQSDCRKPDPELAVEQQMREGHAHTIYIDKKKPPQNNSEQLQGFNFH